MSRFWSARVHALTPYVPGEQPKNLGPLVKLNTNENPYPPSPAVLAAIATANSDALRLYPDPDSSALKQAVADGCGLTPAHVFVGNGSDEVLAHVFQALLQHDRPLLVPDISYSFYPVYCGLYGIAHEAVPLADDFSLAVDDYIGRPNGGIVIANPNAPTGRLLPLADIARLAEANRDSVLVIDEAYVDFGGESAVSLVPRFDNLLVVHTLSKSRSLAGLRVGYAIGHPALIAGLERVKNSFNSYPLDRLAQAGAVAALQDTAHFEQTRQAVIRSREALSAQLTALGFEVLPSAANFIFTRHPGHDAAALQGALRERRVIVRHFTAPRIAQFLRISIGTHAECEALVGALRDILASVPAAA
jgi:histidinol-phosphate aminotransferase